ncbi:MAG: 2-C-methyl-D-erythritol 4-phosphate cytidylyltransferase [Clostridiales bacterium]|jgi:2-C-methyl-D-erythritol 4-phosphate cytidylyltransferase|nr:2-C-methyl-D-erythritol 4-phosphate cytidylyltransferase [Clostridiales bacterium]
MLADNTKIAALITAGGMGTRMNAGIPKQFMDLGGKPILARSVEIFTICPYVMEIVVAVPFSFMDEARDMMDEHFPGKAIRLAPGGNTRQESVRLGLAAVKDSSIILVHDSVRPLVSQEEVKSVIDGAKEHGSCTLGVMVKETIKELDLNSMAARTLDRSRLCQIQTPQGFELKLLRLAHNLAAQEGFETTDDTALVERMGHPTFIARGSYRNIKITTEEDLACCLALLRREGRLDTTAP